MESCFPPLAALSLRGSVSGKKLKNRHSMGSAGMQSQNGGPTADQTTIGDHYYLNTTIPQSQSAYTAECMVGGNRRDYLSKLEVLQDLDLYYIRQMASSLKVNMCVEIKEKKN